MSVTDQSKPQTPSRLQQKLVSALSGVLVVGRCVLRVQPYSKEFAHDRQCAVTGVSSGAVVSTCVQPLDVVRTRMQAEATRSGLQSMVGTVRTIYAEGGTRCASDP